MLAFLSYHFDEVHPEDERFIHRVSYHLNKQADLHAFCYAQDRRKPDWEEHIGEQLKGCDKFVLFVGREFGAVQLSEAETFYRQWNRSLCEHAVCVMLPEATKETIPNKLFPFFGALTTIRVEQVALMQKDHAGEFRNIDDAEAKRCAKKITESNVFWGPGSWLPPDGLPIGYPFAYEKTIIDEFVSGNGYLKNPKRIEDGCPLRWPEVHRDRPGRSNPIPQEVIGGYGKDHYRIIVDTRSKFHNGPQASCLARLGLTFPEARPREELRHPKGDRIYEPFKVGILVSGGIAPGINAVIAGIVERHWLYRTEGQKRSQPPNRDLEVRAYRNGLGGLLNNKFSTLTLDDVRDWSNQGGSMIGTSRLNDLLDFDDPAQREKRSKYLDELVTRLEMDRIDVLYIVGGDGSMKAAHALWTRCKEKQLDISVVGIPKTMDNDILWVWQAFGFLSAVEKAREFVMELHTEATSNPRLCVVQLFGSDSGFVVSHAALSSGVCDLVLIPEVEFSMTAISRYICGKLENNRAGLSSSGMILMAETAIPTDAEEYLLPRYEKIVNLEEQEREAIKEFIKNGRRVQGQTQDELRRAGLKIVSRILERDIREMPQWNEYRVFTNEPRHLLRAIAPSAQDVTFGQRLGVLAVDNAMAGYTDFMISQWLTEYVLVPLELVVLGRKRVPDEGIFWKSVLANTSKDAKLL